MLAHLCEVAKRVIAQVCSEACLLHLLLLGVALAVYLKRGPKVDAEASQHGGEDGESKNQDSPAEGTSTFQDAFLQALPRGMNDRGQAWSHKLPDYASVHGVLHRGEDRDFIVADAPEAYCWENEYCSGKYLPMFRPTADPSKDKPGIYPYHAQFKGRKRLWEQRMQFKFKKTPEGDGGLRFGIQLAEYVPLGPWAVRSMKVVIAALRRVVGQDLYHSPGEPPKSGQESELPTFVMPLWAFDQFIVTPEGEDPPDLHDPHFGSFGMHRVDDRKKFIEELSQLEFKPGCTYTFSCWGVSQFVDCVRWTIAKVLPVSIDFNTFCSRPPVTVCCYSLRSGSLTEADQRHLESRKQYYFRCEAWATKKAPSRQQIKDLFPMLQLEENPSNDVHKKRSWMNFKFLACCSGPRKLSTKMADDNSE